MLLVFFILLAYIIMLVTSPTQLPVEDQLSSPFLCADGEVRPCASGDCEGTSTCVKGVWGGCRWEQVCAPGLREPCIIQGCAYAVRECNECGTGWSECHPFPAD